MQTEDLQYLTDKQLTKYFAKDDNVVRVGEYVVYSGHTLLRVVARAEKGYLLSSIGSLNSSTMSESDFDKYCKKATRENLIEFVNKNRKETFKKTYVGSNLNVYMKIIPKMMSRILPEEMYELTHIKGTYVSGKERIELTIHLPEFQITNSTELSHIIKDFFVKLTFFVSGGRLTMANPGYARTTYTTREVKHKYKHSHTGAELFSKGFDNYFCYGNTTMAKVISRFSSGDFCISQLPSFIVNLLDLLKWESLEGTPHRYISKLSQSVVDSSSYRDVVRLNANAVEIAGRELLALIAPLIDSERLKFGFVSERIVLDTYSSQYIDNLCTENCSSMYRFERDHHGRALAAPGRSNQATLMSVNGASSGIKFKGNEIKFKIEDLEVQENNSTNPNLRVHHDIRDNVIKQITMNLTSQLIEEYYEQHAA